MSIGRPNSLHDDIANVGNVIAVGVFQKNNIRLAGNDHPTIPEFKTERIMNFGEFLHFIGFTILVGILEN